MLMIRVGSRSLLNTKNTLKIQFSELWGLHDTGDNRISRGTPSEDPALIV